MRNRTSTLARAIDSRSEKFVTEMLARADVRTDGERPWDFRVNDPRFYTRALLGGKLGVGEAYMDGMWDCDELDEATAKIARARLDRPAERNFSQLLQLLRGRAMNLQSRLRAFQVGQEHYDLGNDLYEAMLDKRLAYTCGYWKDADNLDDAQDAKLDLVCRKVGLKPGMRVLELGCGWGSFAQFAAQNYGVEVVGYTVSKAQVALGMERCKGLNVDLRLDDYRKAQGTFDAVVSIGIMEHIGPKNYSAYFDVVERCLAEGGVGLVHTIAGNRSKTHMSGWYDKYIFPNAVLPSLAQLSAVTEDRFVIEDVHNIGAHYDKTLMAWFENFEAAWPQLRDKYGDRFYRMWRYYLLQSAGGFRGRYMQLYQLVFTRFGDPQPECRFS